MMPFIFQAGKTVCPSQFRQSGVSGSDVVYDVAIGNDGSVFLAGTTFGDWNDTNAGDSDFAAAKLDADGNEVWRWQVRL